MILELLLNILMIWIIVMKILMNTIQVKKHKILIVFDNIIAGMFKSVKRQSILTELFIRGGKLNISLVFIKQPYFAVPKNIRINSTYYFIMKIPNK